MRVSSRTGKNSNSRKNSISDHMFIFDNIVSFEDFSVLANGTNNFRKKL